MVKKVFEFWSCDENDYLFFFQTKKRESLEDAGAQLFTAVGDETVDVWILCLFVLLLLLFLINK